MTPLLERVATLPPDTIVYYSIFSVDGDGQRFIPRDALAKIAAASNAPIFGDLDSYMGTGAVGGQMTDVRAFGAAIATHTAPILRGGPPVEPPPGVSNSWSAPVVDWRALKRFGVPASRLPAGVDIRYREPTLWEAHRLALLGVAAAFLVLLALVIRLLQERRQRFRAEREASARLTELARANRISAAGEMAAAIVHDLGQPLAAIQSNVESIELLLGADPPRLDEARAALADVRRDDERAAGVIGRMRSLFHKSGPSLAPLRANGLVEELTRMVSGAASRRRAVIETDVDPLPMVVRADAIQLQQVFINLVLNALEAIPEGAARRSVAISARRVDGGGIRFAVGDSGPGIAEADRARVFEPFYTTKETGTGVGLAIVRRIVESFGARIEIGASRLGGAEFSFVLPEIKAER
jgi:signal transduction histidine kinase